MMKLTKYIFVFAVSVLILASCSSSVRFAEAGTSRSDWGSSLSSRTSKSEGALPSGTVIRGYASYYHDKFNGRTTANGEIYNSNSMTAAHKTLPFGTKAKVTNLKNGKSTIVIINDRGPFVADRIIDLSRAAAESIDMIKDGVAEVEIQILD